MCRAIYHIVTVSAVPASMERRYTKKRFEKVGLQMDFRQIWQFSEALILRREEADRKLLLKVSTWQNSGWVENKDISHHESLHLGRWRH